MQQEFEAYLAGHFPELRSNGFLLACSGGLDSTVLAHLCHEAGLDFKIAHCNFHLRGTASDGDAEFVGELAQELKKDIHSKSFDLGEYIRSHNASIQMAARAVRYEWFEVLRQSEGLEFTVTAHHADDSLETFLINLGRGSGLDGLTGIPAKTGWLRRPLLPFNREELLEFAKMRGLKWREDTSNQDPKYLRNRLRLDVIPALKDAFPGFLDSFSNTLSHLRDSRLLVEKYVEGVRTVVFSKQGDLEILDLAELRRLEPMHAHLFELLSPYGFTDWKAIAELLDADPGREVHSPSHRLLRDRERLLLGPQTGPGARPYSFDLANPGTGLPIRFRIDTVSERGPASEDTLYVDKETLNDRLILRKWQPGDYFYPLGMKGKKKVAKFFKDLRLDQFRKEEAWLLCSGNAVVWLVGYRPDDRFKVTESTREILRIVWEK